MLATEPSTDSQQPAPRDYVIEAILMLLAVLPVMVSFHVSLVTGEGHWFQRSGALMILFSVGVEYHRRHMLRGLGPDGAPVFRHSQRIAHLVTRFWRSVPFVCYLAIVMGTLVWSYGDLLF